jgi:hypothetical protein
VVISPGLSDKVKDVWPKKKGNGVYTYRSRYNFELDMEFNSPNVIGVVKSNIVRYVMHMIRGVEDLPQRTLYRAVTEGRRNQTRLKSKWVDSMNSDNKTLEGIFLRQALIKSWF